MINIDEVTDSAQLDRYRGEWTKLVAAAGESDFFHTPEWLTAWLECFWPGRPISFLFLKERQRLVGMVPLLRDDHGDIWCSHSFSLPVNPHAVRSDIVHLGEPSEMLRTLLAYFKAGARGVRLALRQLKGTSTVFQSLPRTLRQQGLAMLAREGSSSPIIRINGDFASYLSTRPTHLVREMRRKVRKLERSHRVKWVTATNSEECQAVMPDVMRIEKKSWKEELGSSMSAQPAVASFYGKLAQRCAENGWLRLHLLYLDSTPVAHIYGVVYKNEYYAIKTSFDEAHRASSPGVALFNYAIEDSFQRGLEVFDFLGVESRWKSELATDTRYHWDLCIFSKGLFGCQACSLYDRICEQHLKPFLRRRFPALVSAKRALWRAAGRALPALGAH